MLRFSNSKSGKSIVYLLTVMLMVFLLCAIPKIWLSIKPVYIVTGAIRVSPVLSDILTREKNNGLISDYERFKNTHVEMITTNAVVQKVADTLVDRKLSFFWEAESYGLIARLLGAPREKARNDPAYVLKRAIFANKSIVIAADRRSELIKITMQNKNLQEAKMIVDAFITTYMESEFARSLDDRNQQSKLMKAESSTLQTQKDGNRDHPSSISVAYYGDITAIRDNRVKYTIGIVVGVIACGVVLAALGKAKRRSSKSVS